jgi:hypothetical protein
MEVEARNFAHQYSVEKQQMKEVWLTLLLVQGTLEFQINYIIEYLKTP